MRDLDFAQVMREKDFAQLVTATFWQVLLDASPCITIGRLEEVMRLGKDSLRTAKNSQGGLRLKHITGALDVLGFPAPVFFDNAIGGIATTAMERFMARGAQLSWQRMIDLPALPEHAMPDRLTEDDLARLDAARFEDPRATAEQAAGLARQAARDGRRGDTVAAVGRQGSALRVAELWGPAWVCVWWALRHAPPGRHFAADLSLRGSAVLTDFGEFADAAELASSAAIMYFELRKPALAGLALVSRGVALLNDDQYEEAIAIFEASLEYLPSSDNASRVAAAQNLGLAWAALGEFDQAERQAQWAEALPNTPTKFVAHLLWLRARIAVGRERYPRATDLYRQVLAGLHEAPGHAALAGAELCKVYLSAGQSTRAIDEAKRLAALALPKNQNPTVASAILELFRAAQAGGLEVELVDRVIATIKAALGRRATLHRGPTRRTAGTSRQD